MMGIPSLGKSVLAYWNKVQADIIDDHIQHYSITVAVITTKLASHQTSLTCLSSVTSWALLVACVHPLAVQLQPPSSGSVIHWDIASLWRAPGLWVDITAATAATAMKVCHLVYLLMTFAENCTMPLVAFYPNHKFFVLCSLESILSWWVQEIIERVDIYVAWITITRLVIILYCNSFKARSWEFKKWWERLKKSWYTWRRLKIQILCNDELYFAADPLAHVTRAFREHLLEKALYSLLTPGYENDSEAPRKEQPK